MDAITEINELAGRLLDTGFIDEGILIGLVATALEENRGDDLHAKLEELLPEYTSNSLKEILLRNSINQN